ncbi:MAG: xylulokinase, partial [Anaerolineae bacterium]|nr:xylulokinase [Anaerolineae bacterium]
MYLGIDLGTQSLKAVLVDEHGTVVRIAQQSYPILRPQPTYAEQNPEAWWQAMVWAVQEATRHAGNQIRAMGIAGQMHGLVALDKDKQVLRPAIIWMDQRSAAECEIQKRENWLTLAHNQLVPGFMAASLLWMKRHEPELFARIDTVLTPKDWLRWKLTGALCTEVSDASGTLLLDIQKRQWSPELLDIYGFEARILPHVLESAQVIEKITVDASQELGLSAMPKVVAGAADQAAMLIGCGVLEPGQAVLTIGTGGQFSVVTDHPQPDPRLNTFCHAVPSRWYSMGAILAAGYALTWWKNVINGHLEAVLRQAAKIPAGAEGVIFHPYLNGERTPHLNPQLTASFEGLTGHHT